jgi:hypothetical protein
MMGDLIPNAATGTQPPMGTGDPLRQHVLT